MPLDVAVEKYVQLRDKVDAIRKQHVAQLAPYALAMAGVEALLLDALNTAGADAMKAPAGTFYKHQTSSVKVTRWSETLKHIQDNGLWELLDPRVNKTAAQAIMEETSLPIPGVQVERVTVVHVRRAG